MIAAKEEVLVRLNALAAAVRGNDPGARAMVSETIHWLSKDVDISSGRPIRELLFNARGQLDIRRPDSAAKNIDVAIRAAKGWR